MKGKKWLIIPFLIVSMYISTGILGRFGRTAAAERPPISEEAAEKAMGIIQAAGETGLSEIDIARLEDIGLNQEQIDMLIGLNDEPANGEGGTDGWVEKKLGWIDWTALLFLTAGCALAAVMLAFIWLGRKLLWQRPKE